MTYGSVCGLGALYRCQRVFSLICLCIGQCGGSSSVAATPLSLQSLLVQSLSRNFFCFLLFCCFSIRSLQPIGWPIVGVGRSGARTRRLPCLIFCFWRFIGFHLSDRKEEKKKTTENAPPVSSFGPCFIRSCVLFGLFYCDGAIYPLILFSTLSSAKNGANMMLFYLLFKNKLGVVVLDDK